MNRASFLFVVLVAAACKSGAAQGYKIHAVNFDFELDHEVIRLDDIELQEIYTAVPGGVLNSPPLMLADVQGQPALAEMFGPLGWSASARFSEQGILSRLQGDDGVTRAHRLVLRLVLDYDEVEKLELDFPHLGPDKLANMPRTQRGHLRFAPITVRLIAYPSDDRTAIRIVLDSVTVYESAGAIEQRGDSAEKPLPFLTTVTYHYPDPTAGTTRFTTAIFDHKLQATDGIFVGHRQYTPWIPLQSNPLTAPFDLRIGVTEVTNRSWLKRFTGQMLEVISPLMRTYRGVR
jgi:hypothetical protein